jgi:hypothetical protein
LTGVPASSYIDSIAVSPANASECFLAVAGNIASGAGGPYRSTDGGNTWTWLGAGLPADSWFFNSSFWLPGPQIATGPGTAAGCEVAILRAYANSVYTLNRTTMQWTALPAPPGGASPNAIVADPSQTGVWIVSSPQGIYRIVNGVLSTVYSGDVTYLAADKVTQGRFAASTTAGVLLSTDDGVTWNLLDTTLPAKLEGNPLAFAGNRLVVGSGGSGVFYINLSPSIIVDNTDSSVTTTGTWLASSTIGGYYGTNYFDDGNANKGSMTLKWTPTISTAGWYTVYARWTASGNRPTNTPYTVNAANGSFTTPENQQINGGTWVSLGVYSFNAGTSGNVVVSNTGTSGTVIADAVDFVPLSPSIIMDNNSAGVTTTGTWYTSSTIGGYYGTDYLDDGNVNKGSTSLTWTPTITRTGSYTVYALWTASGNRATNTPYTVNAANGSFTIPENQQINGGTWVSLGVYSFNAGTSGNVVVSNTGTNGTVIANAVEFVPQ